MAWDSYKKKQMKISRNKIVKKNERSPYLKSFFTSKQKKISLGNPLTSCNRYLPENSFFPSPRNPPFFSSFFCFSPFFPHKLLATLLLIAQQPQELQPPPWRGHLPRHVLHAAAPPRSPVPPHSFKAPTSLLGASRVAGKAPQWLKQI